MMASSPSALYFRIFSCTAVASGNASLTGYEAALYEKENISNVNVLSFPDSYQYGHFLQTHI
jgi:hypothetical protein